MADVLQDGLREVCSMMSKDNKFNILETRLDTMTPEQLQEWDDVRIDSCDYCTIVFQVRDEDSTFNEG